MEENYIESVETPEVAEPVDTEVSDVTVEETTESATEAEVDVQSAEDNAKYAAARRRAEQEFAERQRAEDAEYERRFRDYENPITHQPIRSRKDYFDALDAQEKLRMEQNLSTGNVSTDDLNSYIERQIANNPAVMQAQQIIEQTRQSQIETQISEDVKAIQRLDSSVKSIDDILNAPNATQIISLCKNNNMSLVEAYKLANFDTLLANGTKGAKQAAINNIKGVQHLNTTDGVSAGDDGGVDIPQSELSQWRRAYPDLSLKEIRKKYNKVLGS